jgi:hypothetical protein
MKHERNIFDLKRLIIVPLFILFLFLVYDGIASPSYPWRYHRVEQNFASLRIGMTKEQVIQLVGNPKFIGKFGTKNDLMGREIWILHFRSGRDKIPVCRFKLSSNTLHSTEMTLQKIIQEELD